MKKLILGTIILLLLSVGCNVVNGGSLTTRMSSYAVLHTCDDVNATPDTTLLTDINSFAPDDRADDAVDLLKLAGAGKDTYANAVEVIFTHSHGSDADGTTSTFEMWGSVDNGPREPILVAALTGGTARYVAGSDLITWVDTATVTSYHGATITTIDSEANRIVRVKFDVTGFRYLEGRFTGESSTAVTAVAYIRYY